MRASVTGGLTALLLTVGLLTITAGSVAAAPGSRQASRDVSFTFWNSGPDLTTLVNDFNKKFAGRFHIAYRNMPYANETEIVNSALAAHRAPVLVEESLTPSATYADEGIELPIAPILRLAGVNPSVDFPASMWKNTTVHGVHYVAPVDALPTVLFYNKALFRKAGLNPNRPPANAAQFVADARKITNSKRGIWGYVQEPGWPNPFLFPSLLAQFGGREANAATRKIMLDSPAGVKALTFEWDSIFKWHVSPVNASNGEAHNLFVKGTNAMQITGAYDFSLYRKALGSDLGMAPVPVIGAREADFLGQNYWWLFKSPAVTASVKRAVAAWFKYFYSNGMTLAHEGTIPVWESTLRSPAFERIDGMPVIYKMVQTGVLNPLIPNWGTTTTTYLYNEISLVLEGKVSPKQGLYVAGRKMQQVMATLP